MKVTLVHVGDFKEDYLRAAEREYVKRLGGYCNFRTVCVKEEQSLSREAERILPLLPARGVKIALCVEGREYTSEEFAAVLDNARQSASEICFVIGSSCGLDESVKAACGYRVSFSRMTFPHQLMRIIFEEQLYRAFTIISGKTYHK